MAFPFTYVCDLLESLERLFRRQVPLLDKDLDNRAKLELTRWFKLHKRQLDLQDVDDSMVMSMLRPELDTERAFGVNLDTLSQIIARSMELSRQHYLDLQQWRSSEFVDLGGCVQRLMHKLDYNNNRRKDDAVTVEEIHQSLLQIASFNPDSSERSRTLASTWESPDEAGALGGLYRLMQAKEAKWLTRFILKSYAPIKVPQSLNLTAEHSFLPNCLTVSMQIPSLAPPTLRREGRGTINVLPTPKSVISTTSNSLAGPVTPQASLIDPKVRVSVQTTSLPAPPTSSLTKGSIQSVIRRCGGRDVNITLPSDPYWLCRPPTSDPAMHTPISAMSKPRVSRLPPISRRANSQLQSSTPAPPTQHLPGRQPETSSVSVVINIPPKPASLEPTLPDMTTDRSILGTVSSNIRRSSHHSISQHSISQLSTSSRYGVPKDQRIRIVGHVSCQIARSSCKFTRCLFLLSPCISRTIKHSTYDPFLYKHGLKIIASLSSASFTASALPKRCPQTRRRYRKIALVDSKRVEATATFLKQISRLGLKRKGKKEWVEVYDFHLLDHITRMEEGRSLEYDPWKRNWVGAV